MAELGKLAYVLALIGGILLVVFGFLSLLGSSFNVLSEFRVYAFPYAGIVSIIFGIIAIIGAKSVMTLVWAIILLIVGILAGGLGGLLVALGAIIGLIVAIVGRA